MRHELAESSRDRDRCISPISLLSSSLAARVVALLAVAIAVVGVSIHQPIAVHAGLASATALYSFPTGSQSGSNLIHGDFNGDGKTDFAFLTSQPDLQVLLGNGDGTFTAKAPVSVPSGGQIAAGDFNSDGKLDLALYGWYNNMGYLQAAIWIFAGNGDGTVNVGSTPSITAGGSPGSLAVGDFNGDGKLDLAYSNGPSTPNLFVSYGNGAGVFAAGFSATVGSSTPGPIAVGDFDADGKQDLAVASIGTVVVLLNKGTSSASYALSNSNASVGSIASVDLNGDGKPDLALTDSYAGNFVSIFINGGSGTFGSVGDHSDPGGTPKGIASVDLNADGKPDLVVGEDASSGSVETWINQSGGKLAYAATYSTTAQISDVFAGTLNGDSHPDVVALGYGAISELLGNGLPSPPTNVSAVAGVGSATVSWTAAADNAGSALTGYEILSSGGGTLTVGPSATTAVIAGLSTAVHTFTVEAINSNGSSQPSAPSNSVSPLPGGTYNPLTPARIIDTRNGTGGVPVAPLGPNGTLTYDVLGQGGVPASRVSAVILNVTVTDTTKISHLTVWPAGVTMPYVSNLDWAAGQSIPNQVEVAVGAGGDISFNNYQGATDLVVDAEGWVGDNTDSYGANGLFDELAPYRLLDTRNGTGAPMGALGPGQTLNLQVAGRGGVPASGAQAVVMNLTVTQPSYYGYLTAYPTGVTRPLASNLNFTPGETIPNRVTVGLGTGGQVSIYNGSTGAVQVIADVNGWFTDRSSTAGGSAFVGVVPERIIDTRTSATCSPYPNPCPLGPQDEWLQEISGATGLVLNVTATNTTTVSYLTVFPSTSFNGWTAPPNASDLNFTAGVSIPNSTVVKLGPSPDASYLGFIIYNAYGYVDVIVDVDGYYGDVVPAPPTVTVATHPQTRFDTATSGTRVAGPASGRHSVRSWRGSSGGAG